MLLYLLFWGRLALSFVMLLMFSGERYLDISVAKCLVEPSMKTLFDIFNNSSRSLDVKLRSLTFPSRWLMRVSDPLGGQTVTTGNSSSVMGWVVIVVDTGDSCHSWYELVISQ